MLNFNSINKIRVTSICVPKPNEPKVVVVKKSHRYKFKLGNAGTRLAVVQTQLAPDDNFLIPNARQDHTSTVTGPAEENLTATVITEDVPSVKKDVNCTRESGRSPSGAYAKFLRDQVVPVTPTKGNKAYPTKAELITQT